MSKEDYRRALEAAVREYETLMAERASLEVRLAQLQHTIATLTKLCGFEPTVSLGLTDACRLVLRNSLVPLTALEVRDRLASIGIELSKYSNPLASIHTVLKRMQESGELVERDREEGQKTAYVSIARSPGVTISPGKRRVTGQGLTPPKDRKK